MITIKSDAALRHMRAAGDILGEVFDKMADMVKPGITTLALDAAAESIIIKRGAVPSFKGYKGFPATLCTSVNEAVVHGIPRDERLKDGSILSVDVGCIVDGYHADSAFTYPVGHISDEAQRLLRVTRECLFKGMERARAGLRVGDISAAVQAHAEAAGYGVVRALVGHGVGQSMHEDPEVPNFGSPGRGARLRRGMTIAIEPMIVTGHYDVSTLEDDWTVVTDDGGWCAHYEHTVLITDGDPVMLTSWSAKEAAVPYAQGGVGL